MDGEDALEIQSWMDLFSEELQTVFQNRLVFVGLQGSRGRGEGRADSDIDVVVVLDVLTLEDLDTYAAALDSGNYPYNQSFRAKTFNYTYDESTGKISRSSGKTVYPSISDALGRDFGTLTYDEGFIRSSNVGICCLLADYLPAATFEEYLERFAEPESITLSEFCNVIPGRGSNDESRVCSIFDLHSYEEVKAVYDNLASRPRDAALSRQIHLWAHSYKLSMNHLFGIPD